MGQLYFFIVMEWRAGGLRGGDENREGCIFFIVALKWIVA